MLAKVLGQDLLVAVLAKSKMKIVKTIVLAMVLRAVVWALLVAVWVFLAVVWVLLAVVRELLAVVWV